MENWSIRDLIPSFESTDKFTVNNYTVFVTKLDRKTSDFAHIIGKFIRIDGKIYKGVGVDTYAIVRPCNSGLPICIKVEKGN